MARPIEHGLSHSPTYVSWRSMLARCDDPAHDSFQYYGGRGIAVCERWRNFANFLADMGVRPSTAHTIDRIKINENYKPENCKWSTKIEQQSNKRTNRHVMYQGRRMTIAQAWRASGMIVPKSTLHTRLKFNWPITDALETPSVMGRNQWKYP